MGSIIAIDPGAISGWALFREGSLIFAAYVDQITLSNFPPTVPVPGRVIIERPVIYPFGMGNADPDDLIKLAILVGELRGFYIRLLYAVELVKPRTWKGTVPKKIHNARVLAKLTPEELALLPKRPRAKDYDHNMVDAIGLGLWKLETMGKR